MALILAIEPDKKQASAVRALARTSLHAQMVVADSTSHGLQQLDGRVPDLILTSLLLSPKDETALDKHLRGLDKEGHRVPTLVIPVLGPLSRSKGGLLNRLKKPKKTTGTEGCDPATFAAQITEYLDRAAAERALDEPDDDDPPIAARSQRASIRVDKRPDIDLTPASLDSVAASDPVASSSAAASSDLGASFSSVSTPDAPAPQPVEEPVVTERILKDPFSTEGLSRPVDRRADSTPVYGSILFANSPRESFEEAVRPTDVPSPANETPGEPATPDSIMISLREAEPPAQKADEDGAWDEIAIEAGDTGLEITAEPIDLNAFVEELEAVVSSYGKTDTVEPFKRTGDHQGSADKGDDAIVLEIEAAAETAAPVTAKAPSDPPIGLATRYAWPALEGLPAGTDWETTAPGDPDYEMLAGFMAAFEEPIGPGGSRPSKAAPIEPVVVVPAPAPKAVDRESWISLAMRQRYSWPPLEGIECVDLLAEIEPDETGLYSWAEPEPALPARTRSSDPPRLEAKAPAKPSPVEAAAKTPARVEPATKPASRIEPSVRAAVRVEPVAKPAPRIEPAAAARAAIRVEPAAKPAPPVEFPSRTAVRVEAPRTKPPVVPAGTPPVAANPPDQAAAPVVSAPPAAQWLEILTAIRRDIQELRAEHRAEAVAGEDSTVARAPGVARTKAAPSATADDASARSAKARKTQAPAPSQKPTRKRKRATPPKQDEWGFFDPDQCGFAALLAKLEEIEGDEPTTPEQS